MQRFKGAAKSKTIWLAVFVMVGGYLQQNREALAPFVDPKWLGLVDIVLGAGIIAARFFTSKSLLEKGAPTNET